MTATKIPELKDFNLDAFGHLNWVVGFDENSDPDPDSEMLVIAKADQMTDEELEEATMFPRDCGDWIACVDAQRIGNYVGYHVVVDSNCGGFTDTLESGVLTVEEARRKLPSLLEGWRDTAAEHLVMFSTWFTKRETEDNVETIQRWKEHLKEILG